MPNLIVASHSFVHSSKGMLQYSVRNLSNPNNVASPTPMIGMLGLSTKVIFTSGVSLLLKIFLAY